MLVYGDHCERCDPTQRVRGINRALETVERIGDGLQRHSLLVSATVETGQLVQGIADAAFAQEQRDRRGPEIDALSAALAQMARAFCRSWDSGFHDFAPLPRVEGRADGPAEVEMRVPEGFAYYAVYPEAYVEAARRLKLSAPARVIGIRSIGTTLGAVVAAALDAPPAMTVRPFGEPFDRTIALDAELERALLDGDVHYVIVDEGPGQSGSSFGAVADWLTARGVAADRIAVIPSHSGAPGPAVTEARRRWWRSVQREVGDFGDAWAALVGEWSSALVGPLDEAPLDISAGAWRDQRFATGADWPAVVPAWERRKFLLRAGGEEFVAKFAGLGGAGEDKLAIARALHCEGFVPEPRGLAHGFLIERWYADASPLGPGEQPVREIARYIGTRARLLSAATASGASAGALLEMARRNISLELGDGFARALDRWSTDDLDRRIVRVRTDNRLDRHEWLRTASGALIKTDAVDHHQAHDLIGCQDLAWDCAGAIVEFELNQDQARQLVNFVGEWAAGNVDRALLEFYRVAYLAFRLGQARFGATMVGDGSEQQRLAVRGDRYALELRHLVDRCAPRRGPNPWLVRRRNEPAREPTSDQIG
jgi:hypothetical protein